jgi:hypothetical protein
MGEWAAACQLAASHPTLHATWACLLSRLANLLCPCSALGNIPGVPKVHYKGRQGDYFIMVCVWVSACGCMGLHAFGWRARLKSSFFFFRTLRAP